MQQLEKLRQQACCYLCTIPDSQECVLTSPCCFLPLSSAALVNMMLQYFLWYGILGAIFGRKLLWLTKLFRRLPTFIGQFLFGIPGSNTVMAGENIAFAHSEEFIMVRVMP